MGESLCLRRLVRRNWPLHDAPTCFAIHMCAALTSVARLMFTLDRNRGQALCPLNQLNFFGCGVSSNAAVHFQESKYFVILTNYFFRAECVQTKKSCIDGDRGKVAGGVRLQGNERHHIAD